MSGSRQTKTPTFLNFISSCTLKGKQPKQLTSGEVGTLRLTFDNPIAEIRHKKSVMQIQPAELYKSLVQVRKLTCERLRHRLSQEHGFSSEKQQDQSSS